MILPIIPERENFKAPKKGSDGAACYDLFISDIEVLTDGLVICYLGFSSEIPIRYKAELVARSNITKHGWILANGKGIIDSDYRGEWQARFRPLLIPDLNNSVDGKLDIVDFSISPFPYEIGDACVQFSLEKEIEIDLTFINDSTETIRGSGGFGSTDGK